MKRSLRPFAFAVVLALVQIRHPLFASDATGVVVQTSKEAQLRSSAEYVAFLNAQQEKDVSAMLKAAQALVKAFPNVALAHASAGDAYREAGLKKDALDSYQQALQIDSNSGDAEVGMGVLYTRANDATNALEHFERALKITPGSSSLWGMVGLARLTMGNPKDAATALSQSVKLDAAYAKAWYWLGDAHTQAGDLESAKAAYTTYFKMNPKLAEDYWESWLAHEKEGLRGYLQKIIESRREALSDPVVKGDRFFEALKTGDNFALKADYANAIAAYQEAIRNSPRSDSGFLYGAIGFSYGAQGNRKEAIAAFRQSLIDHPNGADGLAGLAILLMSAEQFSEVRKALDELIKIKTDPVWEKGGSMYRAALPRLEAASEVRRRMLPESTTSENRKDGSDQK